MSQQISFETVDDADEAIMNAASELFGAIQRKSIWDDRLRLTKSQLVAEAIESVEGIAGDRCDVDDANFQRHWVADVPAPGEGS
jgi:hypothetical protein